MRTAYVDPSSPVRIRKPRRDDYYSRKNFQHFQEYLIAQERERKSSKSILPVLSQLIENKISAVSLTVTSVIMPIVNQVSVIAHEGFHPGPAFNSESKVSWAVPYKYQDGQFVRQDQMSGQTLTWGDGKEVIRSTTNTLIAPIPISHNINIRGLPSWVQSMVNWGAGQATKSALVKGVNYVIGD